LFGEGDPGAEVGLIGGGLVNDTGNGGKEGGRSRYFWWLRRGRIAAAALAPAEIRVLMMMVGSSFLKSWAMTRSMSHRQDGVEREALAAWTMRPGQNWELY